MLGNDLPIEQGQSVKTYLYACSGVQVLIAKNNPKRRRIIIGNATNTTCWITSDKTAANLNGITQASGQAPLDWAAATHFGLAQGELYAFGSAGATVCVIEVCDP